MTESAIITTFYNYFIDRIALIYDQLIPPIIVMAKRSCLYFIYDSSFLNIGHTICPIVSLSIVWDCIGSDSFLQNKGKTN